MSRISECIDDFEQARLNTGQIFFIMLSLIPMCFLFPTWLVAKFIYEPWVEKLAKMREDLPEIPFLDRWPINQATQNENKTVSKNSVVYESTPKGNVIMRFNDEDEVFEYWCDSKQLVYKELDVVARKYVNLFCCKDVYVDRSAKQLEKFHQEREKYLAEKNGETAEESEEKTAEDDLFVKTKGEKAKDQQKQFIDDRGIINLNKLLAVEDANRFKRMGRFDEYGGWNVEKNSHKLKKEIPNISFSSFKNMFSRKTD
tara:strand:- start:2973 stop:3743 length:771 start_codon:yes stop_codon:yes gene_type:complete